MAVKLSVASLALFLCFAGNEALKCHVCTYLNAGGATSGDSACKNIAGTQFSEECPSTTQYCSEASYSQSVNGVSTESTVRTCGGLCTSLGMSVQDMAGISNNVYCCNEDNCTSMDEDDNDENGNDDNDDNAASSVLPAVALILASLFPSGGLF